MDPWDLVVACIDGCSTLNGIAVALAGHSGTTSFVDCTPFAHFGSSVTGTAFECVAYEEMQMTVQNVKEPFCDHRDR